MRFRRPRLLLLAVAATLPHGLAAQRARVADASAVRIIRVPAPADSGTWDYQLSLVPHVRALTAMQGSTRGNGAGLAMTLQLGARLTAGRQQVGTVSFLQGARRHETPIVVDVAPQQAVTLHAAAALAIADAGETVTLLFTLRNDGNAPDTLALQLLAPVGWSAAVLGAQRLALAPNGAALVQVHVRPPVSITAGGSIVQLKALGRSVTAQAQTTVEVGATREAASTEALRVNSSISYLAGSASRASSVAALSLSGQALPGLDVTGELVTRIDQRDARAVRGASTIGLPVAGSHLRLSGTHGSVAVGRVSLRLPELAGRAIGGDGVALSLRGVGTLGAVAVTDVAGDITQGALTWSGGHGPLAVEAAASRLRNGSLGRTDTRTLDALSVGARVALRSGTTLGVEVADRSTGDMRDVGVAADLQWHGEHGRASLRAQHAPGGSSALALARDAINAETTLKFGESWALNSYGWFAQDGDAAAMALSSAGGAVNPTRRIGSNGELGLIASMTEFASRNAGAQQSSRETELGMRAAGRALALRWELEGTVRGQQRLTRLQGATLVDRTDRLGVRSGLVWPSHLGTLAVRGGFAQANATQASEASLEVQASELRPIPAFAWLTLDGTLQRSYLGRAAMDQAQLTARAFLPGDLTVQLGLVRESWSGTPLMPSRTTMALRLARATRLAGASRWRTRTGVVFEDLDDDGTRDANEPAVAGITLRSGIDVVTSDREGRFRLDATAGSPEIDVRSLRADQRPGTAAARDRWAVPVRTVGRLAVSVRRHVGPTDRSGPMRPSTLIVSATNAAGAEWRAPVGRDGLARFDALPVGTYAITAEDVDAATPLRLDAATVHIARGSGLPGAEPPQVELVERDRPVRLQGGSSGLGVGAIMGGQQNSGLRLRQQEQQKQDERERQ